MQDYSYHDCPPEKAEAVAVELIRAGVGFTVCLAAKMTAFMIEKRFDKMAFPIIKKVLRKK